MNKKKKCRRTKDTDESYSIRLILSQSNIFDAFIASSSYIWRTKNIHSDRVLDTLKSKSMDLYAYTGSSTNQFWMDWQKDFGNFISQNFQTKQQLFNELILVISFLYIHCSPIKQYETHFCRRQNNCQCKFTESDGLSVCAKHIVDVYI